MYEIIFSENTLALISELIIFSQTLKVVGHKFVIMDIFPNYLQFFERILTSLARELEPMDFHLLTGLIFCVTYFVTVIVENSLKSLTR